MLSRRPEASTIETQIPELAPARILEIELGQPLPTISAFDDKTGHHYQRAFCLIRLHTQPLGVVEFQINESGISPDHYAQQIWYTLSTKINEHLQHDCLPPVTGLDAGGLPCLRTPTCIEAREKFFAHAPFVSIIVSTHDRPERIQNCLPSLLALHYPQYEVIIVDNAPSTNATADFIQQTYGDLSQVRYIRENHKGLSLARNCGIVVARGEILAFTDDDVVADPYWLVELVKAFGFADDVACVTGLILPLELETPAQLLFEEHSGFNKGFTRRVFDLAINCSEMPLHPFTVGQFGTGASMAFTARFLHHVGGFDPGLGVGSSTQGGEDLAVFFQVITSGYKLVYEPASLLYHLHRRDYPSLRKQIYSYGIGLAAFLMKSVLDNPRLLFDLVVRLPYGLFFTLSPRSPKNSKKSTCYPKELTRVELKGMLHGPFAYLRSRRAMRDTCKKSCCINLPMAEEVPIPHYNTFEHGSGYPPNMCDCVEAG